MARRLVFKSSSAQVEVKVYRDSEWNEYQCELFIDGKKHEPSTAFTDDKEDAIGTARVMLEHTLAK